ncbi:MAG: hypothetical protein K9M07_04880 [Simkaniaceae bacterium]|nr:hypothetical protein [Simkaniaceae bacterium]
MRYIFLLLLAVPQFIFSKTLIFTTAFNRPDFIELQDKLFKKFFLDDYEYIVFSDANTAQLQNKIRCVCNQLNVKCIDVPQGIHTQPYLPRLSGDNLHRPNIRNCNAVQWAWDNYMSKHNGPVLLMDSDMFLIRPFSAEKLMSKYDIAYVAMGTEDPITKKGYAYMWIALICFNTQTLPELNAFCFNCGQLPNTNAIVDSGGWTYLYLKKYQNQIKYKNINCVPGCDFYCPYRYTHPSRQRPKQVSSDIIIENLTTRGFTKNEIDMILCQPDTIELLFDNHFLHYRAGSNYEKYSKNHLDKKDRILLSFFDKILSANSCVE